MPRHSLFPNSITINYSSNGHPHKQILPIQAVTPAGGSWNVTQRDDSDIDWKDAVDNLVALYAPLFTSADSFDTAELFDYEATEAPAIFLASYTIGVVGTGIGTTQDFNQAVFPFKATGGTSLRLTLMESTIVEDSRASYGGIVLADICDLLDFILGDTDFIITRGGTFPTSSLGVTSKENDKLRERYFLD